MTAVVSWSRPASALSTDAYCAVVRRKLDCYLTACDCALPLTLVDATSADAKLCDDCVFALSIDRTDVELDDLLAAVGARLSIDERLRLLGRDVPREATSIDLRLKQALIAGDTDATFHRPASFAELGAAIDRLRDHSGYYASCGLPYDAMTAEVGGYVGEDVEA